LSKPKETTMAKQPFQIRQPPAKQAGAPSTPFATATGQPKVTDAAGSAGLDFLKTPNGNGSKTPPADRTAPRPQPSPAATTGSGPVPGDIANQQRAQGAPRPVTDRVSATSVTADGSTHGPPLALVPQHRRQTGSVGNERRPFRVKGG
jgi:hypothetical protein